MNQSTRIPIFFAVLLALAAGALIACGGDDDDTSAFPGAGASNDDASDDGASDDNDDTESDGGSGGTSASGDAKAILTLGDTTYEFLLDGTLQVGGTTQFGTCNVTISAFGHGYTTEGLSLAFDIPPVDWENNDIYNDPPEITIDGVDVPGGRWEANARLAENATVGEGNSQVDSWEFDGSTVRGSATYWASDGQMVSGDFEIACPS